MKAKISGIIALILIVIGLGIALWNRNHEGRSPAPESSAEVDASPPSDRTAGSSVTREPKTEIREETAVTEDSPASVAADRLTSQWVDRASAGFERTRHDLVADLELSQGQAEALEELFARREEQLAKLFAIMNSGQAGDDLGLTRKICALIRHKGLRASLADVLSDDQLEAYDVREAKRRNDKVEARAYRDLAEINSVVALTESQKQDVFGVLSGQAAEKVEQEADARAFMSLTYGPMAVDMDSSHIRGLVNMFNADPARNPALNDYGSVEHQRWIEKQKAERIGKELSALQGVLDKDQLERYRKHLESQMAW